MRIVILLFICTFVNGKKCQLTRNITSVPIPFSTILNKTSNKLPKNVTRPTKIPISTNITLPTNVTLSKNVTLPTNTPTNTPTSKNVNLPKNVTLPTNTPTSKNVTLPTNITLPTNAPTNATQPINAISPTNIPLRPTEGGGINDTENANKTIIPTEFSRVLEYVLVVENLQNDLYKRYQSIDNTFSDTINSLIGNVDIIRLLNNTVNRPVCSYFFNETSVDSMKAELEKFERVAIGMYNSLNVTEGNPLFDLKLRHKNFLDLLTGTSNTPVIPVSLMSVIGIIDRNTMTCNIPISFIPFPQLVLNSNITRHDEVLTIQSLISPDDGKYCAFVGINDTVWSNIENKTCKVPNTSYIGMNHIYITNDTSTPVTDTITVSVMSGPALINVLPFDDGTRIISFAFTNVINWMIVVLSLIIFL